MINEDLLIADNILPLQSHFLQQHLLENQAGDFPKQRPPSRRLPTTLTEESRGLHRASCHAEVKTHRPEEDEEQSSVLPRHWDRLGKLVDQDSEEEEEEELELMEGRRHRHIGAEANYENRQSNRTSGREKRENLVGRGSRALTRNEDAEFAIGLLIGTVATADVLPRRKERYREDLQEQIAEQHRNKKRAPD
ncbi:conglutin alpha 2-like [Sander lucioperca]|uniref:conglutin alpha 2-like n=1 Tax=Sander lucioperca TaxID=283035 RepID=UPI001653B042|nr:conglutin alpha 2-like [Sander lucioperca]